ncbi:uracil-DNA glycosylase [Dissulfurirhabdus thermomarina]|uniref:Type-4 uracil-DNA glycosylase n=1 Tax=Dissulfurirhabdus thermomarina TaxID=1765737 RepID=A0A6N9TSC0_DISTH|nr:uracil-DNA glycosylase [Dissulfurirhabdus thermomarina]NDY42347.1 uracil-DNA glycosylase [Dissulfurirhabdus thermomarina]
MRDPAVREALADFGGWLRYLKGLGLDALPRSEALDRFLAPRPARRPGVPEAEAGPAPPDLAAAGTLAEVRARLGDCRRCPLHQSRRHLVFGHGAEDATFMVVGEAPGQEEDRRGLPFVGAAGELLTKMLRAIGFGRDAVYIANVLKCRPPGNRTPEPAEIARCLPFLHAQIRVVRPRCILALGRVAAQALTGSNAPIRDLRGRIHRLGDADLVATYHPSYLLRLSGERQKAAKREAWHDLQLIKARHDSAEP